jgi:hypothetical protein
MMPWYLEPKKKTASHLKHLRHESCLFAYQMSVISSLIGRVKKGEASTKQLSYNHAAQVDAAAFALDIAAQRAVVGAELGVRRWQ